MRFIDETFSKMLLLCYVIPLPDAEGSSLNLGEAFLRDSGGRDGRDQKEVLLPVREVLTDHSYMYYPMRFSQDFHK